MDATEVYAAVKSDVDGALSPFFPAEFDGTDKGFYQPPQYVDHIITTDANKTAVLWRWAGQHEAEFQGVIATHKVVTIRGVTMVDHDPKTTQQPMFERYVDWLDLFNQLGIGLSLRTPIDKFVEVTKGMQI